MIHVNTGQCGLCQHFGASHPNDEKLYKIRSQHEAPEEFIDTCGHPQHAGLHLKVSAASGCDGFELANGNPKK